LHDGTVHAESAGPGQGSVFVVQLPATDPVEAPPRPSGPDPATASGPLRIAIVDDNDDALQTLAFLLDTLGHQVQTFGTAELALQSADTAPAEVYILDIGLPGMSGHELARRLRAHPRTSRAVLFALSGYGQAADLAASREAGFEEHFTKPVDPDRLLQALQALTGDMRNR
jgi:CheY-like chemotaxis protein